MSTTAATDREIVLWPDTPPAPNGWRLAEKLGDGARYQRLLANGSVILSRARERDGKVWTHFSYMVSEHRVPTWKELAEAKDLFLGPDSRAIQVIPPSSEHFSIREVLHLWVCEAGDVVPDFRHLVDGRLGL